jgi:serine/threonine protein kinase/tetratricopeptide (TPR) repeat protein
LNNAVQHIDEIFWEASHLAPGVERESFLDHACRSDPELRQHLARLLQVQPQVGEFLERPFTGPAASPAPAKQCERPGTVIGPYKLLEEIGEGGMGLVFMAEQTQPVRRKVALKVVKPGMDTRQVVARFEAERQALAIMDHPHVAKVFDAGVTESGRPYFVMELVRGVPITAYCDERRLTTRQRLKLFVLVCQAVQHAHRKGVIHRDLKPSNILVTQHDTVAVPKVIDFGIAKATSQPLTELTLFTHFTQMLGTPLYMSPEQAEMNGLDVDTRSDVYSLGVMLYELLTGTTPFESDTLKKIGLDEMRRMIREDEPPTPSQRLNTLNVQACSTISERRGVDERRLGQVLRGELDWIVMRALEKDRDRRYESASAFAADVQRYLNDESVEACPPSKTYRLRKFVRRHRRSLAVAGLFAVVLVAATVVSTWQAVEANAARRLADERLDNERKAQNAAATDAAIARAVSDFLQEDLLRQVDADPLYCDELNGKTNLTVKEALDRAADRIGKRFQNQPLVEAAIRMAIGDAYRSLFEHEIAASHFEKAAELRRASVGPNHPDTLGSMQRLANMYSRSGRHSDAITLCGHVLDTWQAQLGPDDPQTTQSTRDLAAIYGAAGQWDMCLDLLEPLLEKQRRHFGPTHADTLRTMNDVARCYGFQDRFAESIALHEKLLGALKSSNASMQRKIWPMLTFACVCQRAGEYDKADRLFREQLQYHRSRHDNCISKRNDIANTIGFLAVNELFQHHYDAAAALAREALAEKQPETHRSSYFMIALGAALLGQHKDADAEPFLLQGFAGMKQWESVLFANDKRRFCEIIEWVARLYEATNQPNKAREWRERILKHESYQ